VAVTQCNIPFLVQPFMEAGMDSLSIIDLRASLERAFALELPATLLFDHPTIASLAKHIELMMTRSKVSIIIRHTHGYFEHCQLQCLSAMTLQEQSCLGRAFTNPVKVICFS